MFRLNAERTYEYVVFPAKAGIQAVDFPDTHPLVRGAGFESLGYDDLFKGFLMVKLLFPWPAQRGFRKFKLENLDH